jgi:hypothetical protein
MAPKLDEKINVLTPAAEEPITDYAMVISKIKNDAHKSYKGIENVALKNESIKKHGTDEAEP